jgi:hypothetical protein
MIAAPVSGRHLGVIASAIAALAGSASAGYALIRPPRAGEPPGAHTEAAAGVDVIRDQLGGIDHVPDRETLDALFDDDDQAEAALIDLARNRTGEVDPGVRIRALRALALYSGKAVESALADAVDDHRLARDGVDIAYLRAAMQSLAVVAGKQAVRTIAPVLDHVIRDARAAAADALAATRDKLALTPLYGRLALETAPMVRLALEAAIRSLAGSP